MPPSVTPLRLALETILTTRFLTWFSPTPWGGAGGYGWAQRFLHETWLGRKLVAGYWALVGADVIEGTGYEKRPETQKLRSRNGIFWGQSSAKVLNYDTDFMAMVRDGKIKVHVADIEHLSADTVHLADEDELRTDALICATGSKFSAHVKFLPEGIDPWLGIPHYSPEAESDAVAAKVDKMLLEEYPMVANRPCPNPAYTPLPSSSSMGDIAINRPNQPFSLYRFLTPPSARMLAYRNIAFPSAHHATLKPILAQLQALWITAFFAAALTLPSDGDVAWNTMLWPRFMAMRWPWEAGGAGEKYPELTTEWLPYAEVLLEDLGMKTLKERTGRSWWRDLFVSYKQGDFRGLVEEWLALQGKGEDEMRDDVVKSKKMM